MATRRWLKIGGGVAAGITTIVGLFGLLSLLYGFEINDLTGDIVCAGTYESPCISEFEVRNPNAYNVDIYSKDQVKLDFSPGIKDWALFVPDGRCSATGKCACDLKNGERLGFEDWRCVDFTNKTKPRQDKVYNFRFERYSTTTFRLAGIKNDPLDEIKWTFGANDVELDPAWLPFSEDIRIAGGWALGVKEDPLQEVDIVIEGLNDTLIELTLFEHANSANPQNFKWDMAICDIPEGELQYQNEDAQGGFDNAVALDPIYGKLTDFGLNETWCDGGEGHILFVNGGKGQLPKKVRLLTQDIVGFRIYAGTGSVTVDSAVYTLLHNVQQPRSLVWVNHTTGYIFFIDSGEDLHYRKTIDAGASWGTEATIRTGTVPKFAIWYDKWTDGDSGDVIHIVWQDILLDDFVYNSFNTNDDTLDGEVTAFTGVSFLTGDGWDQQSMSITKSKGGIIYVGGWGDNAGENDFSKATMGGGIATSFTNKTSMADGDAVDKIMFLPGNEEATDDIWSMYQDVSANEITVKVYNDSADSWSESAAITSMSEVANFFGWDSMERHSDNHALLTLWSEHESATGDIEFWDLTNSSLFTAKANVVTDDSAYSVVGMMINQQNDDIYVAYQTGTITGSIVYQKSTDDAGSWDNESAMSATSDDHRLVMGGTSITKDGGIWNPIWFNDDLNDLISNPDNAINFSAIPTDLTLVITDPTTGSPVSVNSLDNITVQYNFSEDNVSQTSGVSIDNITIGGIHSEVLQSVTVLGILPVRANDTGSTVSSNPDVVTFGALPNATYAPFAQPFESTNVDYGQELAINGPASFNVTTQDDTGINDPTIFSWFAITQGEYDLGNDKYIKCTQGGAAATSFTHTFLTAFPDANYAAICSTGVDSDGIVCYQQDAISEKTAGSVGFQFLDDTGAVETASNDGWYCAVSHGEYLAGNREIKAGDVTPSDAFPSVTFVTNMANANYSVKLTEQEEGNGGDVCSCEITSKTVSGFAGRCEDDGDVTCTDKHSWVAIGNGDSNESLEILIDQTWNDGLWNTNVTVPTFASGLKDLFVNASSDSSNFAWDTNTEACDYGDAGLNDSCTPPGSGVWDLLCSDNCSYSSVQQVPGNVSITGSGNLTFFSGGIWNFTNVDSYVFINQSTTMCEVFAYSGGGWNPD